MTAQKHKLILASNSPRRQELLRLTGFDFEVFVRDFDEHFPSNIPSHDVAEYLAKEKNRYYRSLLGDQLVITADTTVVLGYEVLNKPINEAQAFEMLSKLSNNTHEVISGVSISALEKEFSFSDITKVHFDKLTDEEIRHYIENYKPFDKAGAYGIQEWIGMTKISSIQGSYYNVMGLPTHKVYQVLKKEFGF